MQEKVYKHHIKNIKDSKVAIVDSWHALSIRSFHRAIGQWRTRLQAIVDQNGGHIEYLF